MEGRGRQALRGGRRRRSGAKEKELRLLLDLLKRGDAPQGLVRRRSDVCLPLSSRESFRELLSAWKGEREAVVDTSLARKLHVRRIVSLAARALGVRA